MPIDPVKWPTAAEYWRVYELMESVRTMPTLRWAYGAMLDRRAESYPVRTHMHLELSRG